MSGAFYAVFVIAALYVVFWYVTNERGRPSGQIGLLAMRDNRLSKTEKKKGSDRRWRPPVRR